MKQHYLPTFKFGGNGWLKRFFAAVKDWADGHYIVLAAVILPISFLPLILVIDAAPHYDIYLYRDLVSDFQNGILPYRDRAFEYPPYVIPLLLLPALAGNENYGVIFKILAFAADAAIKSVLLMFGVQEAKGIRALVPLMSYCVAVPCISYFMLQRYDLFPAITSLAAIGLFSSRRIALAGLMVSIGAGLKLYPIVFVAPLFVAASRERQAKRFAIGLAVGVAPIALLSLMLPWWRFAAFHSDRGLQAESLYASLLWLAHFFGLVDAKWEGGTSCLEVHGASADAMLPWSRALLVVAVVTSSLLACRAATQSYRPSAASLARLLLIPLLAFVVFNQVFSPQYMIWLLPLAALANLRGPAWITAAIPLAAVLTPGFYPSPEYNQGGLTLVQTCVLVARNAILLAAWAFLIRESMPSLGNATAER